MLGVLFAILASHSILFSGCAQPEIFSLLEFHKMSTDTTNWTEPIGIRRRTRPNRSEGVTSLVIYPSKVWLELQNLTSPTEDDRKLLPMDLNIDLSPNNNIICMRTRLTKRFHYYYYYYWCSTPEFPQLPHMHFPIDISRWIQRICWIAQVLAEAKRRYINIYCA